MKTERFDVSEFTYKTGTVAFRVQGRMPDGQQVRLNFATFHEALTKKEELELRARNAPGESVLRKTRLSAEQQSDAEAACRRLLQARTQNPQLADLSLLNVVEFAITNFRPPTVAKKVGEAVTEFIAFKISKGKRTRTIGDYESRLGKLAGIHGDLLVDQITVDRLEACIPAKRALTTNHYRANFHAFFRWCRKKQYCTRNPAEDIERAAVDETEPAILTLGQVKDLLVAARDHKQGTMVPYLALGLFAGLRPAEIERLNWTKINLRTGQITITGPAAKRRKRRLVEITDNLVELLLPYVGRRIHPKNFRREWDVVRRAAGFRGSSTRQEDDRYRLPWTGDVLRHTAISAHFALFEDEGKTAKWAGNTPDVMHDRYKGLMAKGDADLFWSLTPQKLDGLIALVPKAA